MCTNFVPSARQEMAAMAPGIALPADDWPAETYPGYTAPMLMRGPQGALQWRVARFGLVPRWCKDWAQADAISRKTYNARSETAAEKPSFRTPWQQRQWAVVPLQSYFDPCWEEAHLHGGRAVRWQMALAGGQPFGAAGLWDSWVNREDGEVLHSFTLLTVNADGHAVMGRMHRPGDEKRMPVLLAPDQFADWLQATPANAPRWMQAWPADGMVAAPAPRALAARAAATRATATPTATQPEPPQNLSLF